MPIARHLSPDHVTESVRHAVPESIARQFTFTNPANGRQVFVWNNGEREEYQERIPEADRAPGGPKYVFEPGTELLLSRLRAAATGQPVLMVEGSFQQLATLAWAPESFGVVGFSGAWNWVGCDLTWAEERDVVVCLDSDLTENHSVWSGGDRLKRQLLAVGALSVRYMRLPVNQSKDGIDDYLGLLPEHVRTKTIERLTTQAESTVKEPPKRSGGKFFGQTGLMVDKLADEITAQMPVALMSRGEQLAIYRDGVYRPASHVLNWAVQQLLGREYRENHVRELTGYLMGSAHGFGTHVKARPGGYLLNVANGLLDLRTGQLLPWTPQHLSSAQLPVIWDPNAVCPTYEAWMTATVPEQADDLEEVVATMLDPWHTPAKAAFLYGPSRSGKSTFGRLARALIGPENCSSVTLQQLEENRFKAAQLEGKLLNFAAELKAGHVDQVDIFKSLTGGDPIDAERKGIQGFTLENEAGIVFAMNSVPTIGETSRAYFERAKPFSFGSSFAGREDPSIEASMLGELPGILRRWVAAWQRRAARGAYLPTVLPVATEFETKSNRVYEFVTEAYCIVDTRGQTYSATPANCTPGTLLYGDFVRWAADNKRAGLGRNRFYESVRQIPGVVEVKLGSNRTRSFNLVALRQD